MTAVAAPPVHDLLLALAGRLDDDLLTWARELLAVGEDGQAVELVTAALAAERVELPPTLRAALVAAAHGTDLDVDEALPPSAEPEGTPHRFDAAAAPGDAVLAALAALPARRLAGCTLHLTWRCTPAGAAPGPLPRAVVLVEADPDRSAEVLAYLLATELDRAGAPASVEVFTAGATLPAYHVAALRSARAATEGAGGRHGAADATPLFLVPAPDDGEPAATPADAPPDPGDPPSDDTDPELPRRASGRRRRPEPAPVEPPVAAEPEVPAATPEPADPLSDPLRVPLLEPLLDPRGPDAAGPAPRVPEPTRPEPARPEPPRPVVRDAEPETPQPEKPEPSVPAPTAPADVPAEWEEDWRTGEWAMPRTRPEPAAPDDGFDAFGSGERRAPAEREPADGAERTGRMPAAGPPARSGSLFDSPTARVESAPGPETGQRRAEPLPEPLPERRRGDGPPNGDPLFGARPSDAPLPERRRGDGPPNGDPLFGARPSDVPLFDAADEPRAGRRRRPDEPVDRGGEPSGLLGGTERDLLAQLHEELASRERPPRPYRRAGSRNGSVRPVNGHGPDGERPPPDLAG